MCASGDASGGRGVMELGKGRWQSQTAESWRKQMGCPCISEGAAERGTQPWSVDLGGQSI